MFQPFVKEVTPKIDKLKLMGDSVDQQIKSLLLYYGESPDSPDAPKAEDFFGMIATFYSSLQVDSTETHSEIR